jgi:GntR family transcriptional regulator/MocR family aminotransferase
MSDALIYLDPDSRLSLQNQIRQKLVDGIMSGTFPPGRRLPSSRKLAGQLGVSRNTVVLAYEQLIEEGFLDSRERSGIYVNENVLEGRVGFQRPPASRLEADAKWEKRIRGGAGSKPRFQWPGDWQQHPYPFIDGQFDDSLYPTTQWREANRMALGARIVREGSVTEGDADDPVLIEEIRTKMLPRRGINASPDEILITVGEQNALYLLTQLLTDSSVRVVVEEPGNAKMRQLLSLRHKLFM